ncbi:MAG: IS91 family transposase [Desulfobacterales bacterium]|nr:IS91 family transposase [Desulfobacterales bacterium]
MKISSIINQYHDAYIAKYGGTVLPGQLKAMNAICNCRTPASGELYVGCPDCDHAEWKPLSCGHRSCPQCQNHETSQWIDRQQKKILPVPYFLITFTLPRELRPLAFHNQRAVFSLFFLCVVSTLKDFGLNPDKLGAEIGMTMVLHTHSRRLDFHPHIHVVVPGGGIDKSRRQWKKKKGKFLFFHKALAKVFRARFLKALNESKLKIPGNAPKKWVVDCSHAGNGLTAVKYLSRYLYRGVISEKNIISNRNGVVKFKYTDSKTKKTCFRALKGEDFINLIMQHVLPRGFRRVRDYGFLHSNAKKLLLLVQLILFVKIKEIEQRSRPVFKCPCCKSSMIIYGYRYSIDKPG